MTNNRSSVSTADKEASRNEEEVKLAALEAHLAQLCEELSIVGMAAGVLRGRELIWFRGFGYADLMEKTPVTRHTPFHLASLTKTFASTLLMQLVENGRLNLDSPAADYGIKLKSHGTITVRHLFAHTSGGNPGERYQYDGSRFGQLDRVLEQITGRSFEANLNRIIVQPLGLKNTGRMGETFDVALASPYELNDKGDLVRGAYPTYFGSSAGLVASVADYAEYIVALKDNRLLRSETLSLAWTPTRSTAGHDLPYGLGWFVETVKDAKVIWHYGYWHCVSTLVAIVPEQDQAFFAFANTDVSSRGFDLGCGHIVRSPVGAKFLEGLVLHQD